MCILIYVYVFVLLSPLSLSVWVCLCVCVCVCVCVCACIHVSIHSCTCVYVHYRSFCTVSGAYFLVDTPCVLTALSRCRRPSLLTGGPSRRGGRFAVLFAGRGLRTMKYTWWLRLYRVPITPESRYGISVKGRLLYFVTFQSIWGCCILRYFCEMVHAVWGICTYVSRCTNTHACRYACMHTHTQTHTQTHTHTHTNTHTHKHMYCTYMPVYSTVSNERYVLHVCTYFQYLCT